MKTTTKKISGILLTVLLVLSLIGCGDSATSQSSENIGENSEMETAQSSKENVAETAEVTITEAATENIDENFKATDFPITITDHRGQEIIIESKPEKIVSGYYVTSSILIGLDLKDQVVGIEAKADSRPIYSLAAPEFLELPQVGTAKEFNLEGCVALEPDLVVLPLKLKDSAETLESLGITVICVNPENQELLEETLLMIGQATDSQGRAEEMIDFANEQLSLAESQVSTEEKPTVYLGGNSDFLSTAGGKMYQNTLINNAGGINVAEVFEDNYWAKVSYEQILEFNPENIILVPFANYSVESVLKDTSLDTIDAIINEKVFQMPNNIEAWDSPIPSSFLGSLWIRTTLYPEEYSYSDFEVTVKEFYEIFYDFSVESIMVAE